MSGALNKDDEENPLNPPFSKGGKACPELVEGGGFERLSSDERLLIIGLGNPLMCDDGVGIEVVNELKGSDLPEYVDVIDGGTPGVGLIDLMTDYSRVIVVDAVVGACHHEIVSGSLGKENLKQVQNDMGDDNCSLHEMELTSVLKLMQSLEMSIPEITIVGIPAFNIAPGIGLSEECMKLIPQAVKLITELQHIPSPLTGEG